MQYRHEYDDHGNHRIVPVSDQGTVGNPTEFTGYNLPAICNTSVGMVVFWTDSWNGIFKPDVPYLVKEMKL